jgi:hypothetical protein
MKHPLRDLRAAVTTTHVLAATLSAGLLIIGVLYV